MAFSVQRALQRAWLTIHETRAIAKSILSTENSVSTQPEIAQLESRVLLSATPLALPVDAQESLEPEDSDVTVAAIAENEASSDAAIDMLEESKEHSPSDTPDGTDTPQQNHRSHELVFVDTATDNFQQLVDDLVDKGSSTRRFEVILLEND